MKIVSLSNKKHFLGEIDRFKTTVTLTEDNDFSLEIMTLKTPDIPGSLHFLEHLIVDKDILKTMRNNQGLLLNATTSIDSIRLIAKFKYISEKGVYSSDEDYINENLALIEKYVKNTLKKCNRLEQFDDEEVNKERQVILAEFNSVTSDYRENTNHLSQLLLSELIDEKKLLNTSSLDGLLTQRSVIGRRKDIERITSMDLNRLNFDIFTADNTYVKITVPKALMSKLTSANGFRVSVNSIKRTFSDIFDILNDCDKRYRSLRCQLEGKKVIPYKQTLHPLVSGGMENQDLVQKDLDYIFDKIDDKYTNKVGDLCIVHNMFKNEPTSINTVYFDIDYSDKTSIMYNSFEFMLSIDKVIASFICRQVFNKYRENGGAVYSQLSFYDKWFKSIPYMNLSTNHTLTGFNIKEYNEKIGIKLKTIYEEVVSDLFKGNTLDRLLDSYIESLLINTTEFLSNINMFMNPVNVDLINDGIIRTLKDPYNINEYIEVINKYRDKTLLRKRIKNLYKTKVIYIIQG